MAGVFVVQRVVVFVCVVMSAISLPNMFATMLCLPFGSVSSVCAGNMLTVLGLMRSNLQNIISVVFVKVH